MGTRYEPHSALSCELFLRAVGAARGRPGGAERLLPGSRVSAVGRPPSPDRPSLGRAAGAHYPLAVSAGGVGVGTRHQLHSARSCELALRAVGRHEGARGGEVPLAWVWGVRGWALTRPDRPSLGRAAGARYPLAVVASGVGVGTRHQSQSARSCELGLRAVGRHEGTRGGAPLACVWGVRGWAVSHAQPSVLGACVRGPLTTACGCGGCGRGDPSQTPQRALLRADCAPCGGGTRALGRLLPACGASGVGRSPTPDRPSLGRAAGAHYPLVVGAGGVGDGTRHQPHGARSCELTVRVVEAARGRPGGAPPACVWGVQGWALSHARPPVLGACGRGLLPTDCRCGGCGRGDPSPTP